MKATIVLAVVVIAAKCTNWGLNDKSFGGDDMKEALDDRKKNPDHEIIACELTLAPMSDGKNVEALANKVGGFLLNKVGEVGEAPKSGEQVTQIKLDEGTVPSENQPVQKTDEVLSQPGDSNGTIEQPKQVENKDVAQNPNPGQILTTKPIAEQVVQPIVDKAKQALASHIFTASCQIKQSEKKEELTSVCAGKEFEIEFRSKDNFVISKYGKKIALPLKEAVKYFALWPIDKSTAHKIDLKDCKFLVNGAKIFAVLSFVLAMFI